MKNIKVLGIDPAPSKNSTIFDGNEFHEKSYTDLVTFLEPFKTNNEKALICWDAPLSFSLKSAPKGKASPFYQRKIEAFFAQKKWGKTPSGISVLGYAGCPHWAISQHILGYPKIGNFEKEFNPPFKLIFDKDSISKSVTEVHPAVAIWLWCRKEGKGDKNWINEDKFSYKKNEHCFEEIIKLMLIRMFPLKFS